MIYYNGESLFSGCNVMSAMKQMRKIKLLLSFLLFGVLKVFAASEVVYPDIQGASSGLTVRVAHITLMHPLLEPEATNKPFYQVWTEHLIEYYNNGKQFDYLAFQKELDEGWYPDERYAALKDIVRVLAINDIDIVSFSGVYNRTLARHLIYYLYSQSLHKSFIPVSGVTQNSECNLCRKLHLNEEGNALIFSRYPLYSKFTNCTGYKKTDDLWAFGCVTSSKVVHKQFSFRIASVNTASFDQIESANQSGVKKVFIDGLEMKRSIDFRLESLQRINDFFSIDRMNRNKRTGISKNETVVFTGFFGAEIVKVMESGKKKRRKKNQAMLESILSIDLSDIPSNLTSLDFMSNENARRWYNTHNGKKPDYNALVDLVAVSKQHTPPLSVSSLKAMDLPPSQRQLSGHRMVYRQITVGGPQTKPY